jgi:hypothetical protein
LGRVKRSEEEVRSAEWFIVDESHVPSKVTMAYEKVKTLMKYGTDDIDSMVEATRSLNEALGNVQVS